MSSDTPLCVMSFGHALLLAGMVAEPSLTLGSPPVTFIQEIPCLAHLSSGLALHVTVQLEYWLWRLHEKLVLFLWDLMLAKHSHSGQDQLPMSPGLSVIYRCVTLRLKTTVISLSSQNLVA